MIERNTTAAKRFFKEVKIFSENAKGWDTDVIWHEVRPDEVLDPTLIAQRVYKRRDEFLAVMAAAGIDSVDQAIEQKTIALPSFTKLISLKHQTGLETEAELRENFGPLWEEDNG